MNMLDIHSTFQSPHFNSLQKFDTCSHDCCSIFGNSISFDEKKLITIAKFATLLHTREVLCIIKSEKVSSGSSHAINNVEQ